MNLSLTEKDIKDLLENFLILLLLDLICLLELVLYVTSCRLLILIIAIHILRYLKKAPRQGLLYEEKGKPKSLGIVMLIGQDLLSTNALQQDIVF